MTTENNLEQLNKEKLSIEKYPDISIFSSNDEIKDILIQIKKNINILKDSYYLIQNKHYRIAWKKFIYKTGIWLSNQDLAYWFDIFDTLSYKYGFQLLTIWFFEGFLLNIKLDEETIYKILNLFKETTKYISINNYYINKRDYLSFIVLISKFITKYSPSQWKEWILEDFSNLENISKINNYQEFLINISLYYLKHINSDKILTSNLLNCIMNLIIIIASDSNSYSKLTINYIIEILIDFDNELSIFITGILKQIKKSTKCMDILNTLEYIIEKTINNIEWNKYFCEIILIFIDLISNLISNIISNSNNKIDNNNDEIKMIKKSLNICSLISFNKANHNEILSQLEYLLLNINSNRNNLHMKISYLIISNTIIESLVKYKIINKFFKYEISTIIQENLLSLMDINIPINSNNFTDHFKILTIHLNSLIFALINGSSNYFFSDKYLLKINSFIINNSLSEINKLMIISSFIRAIHLIKIFKFTDEIDINNITQIIFSNNTLNIFKSTLNKTTQLKKLSINIIGEIILIKDMFNENDIIKRLDIINNIKNSIFLYPKLSTIIDNNYNFLPINNNNGEINQFIFLLEIISNNNNIQLFNINYSCLDELKLNLYNYIEILKDMNKFQSLSYSISFLIQLGRILSFISFKSNINLIMTQYSIINIEVFQGLLLIPNLKKPFIDNDNIYSISNILKNDKFFDDIKVCQNMIISFTIILSSLYSIKEKNKQELFFENQLINNFKCNKLNLFNIWISLFLIKNISNGPSKIGCSYSILLLLFSYHPLLFLNKKEYQNKDLFLISKKKMKYHNYIIEKIISSWNIFDNIDDFNNNLIELYNDLIYLPINEKTGIKKAALNFLKFQSKINNLRFSLDLINLLNSNLEKSLEFICNLPSEFDDFIISDPNNVYEFNYKINHKNNDQCFEDIQTNILNKLKLYMSSETKYNEFSEFYDFLLNPKWIQETINNLEKNSLNNYVNIKNKEIFNLNNFNINNGINNNNNNNNIHVDNGISKNNNNNNNMHVNNNNASVFTIAKLRKTQTDNKSKSKMNKNSNINHNLNSQFNSKAKNFENTSSIYNNNINTSNMTKKDIILQKLKEQGFIRKETERIISQIKNIMLIMTELLNSIQINNESQLIRVIDINTSEIIFNICNKLIRFKPLKKFLLKNLKEILTIYIGYKKLVNSLINYLFNENINKIDDLQMISNSILSSNLIEMNINTFNYETNYFKYSSGISILIYIISEILYINCIEDLEESNKQIQISSQLILFISLSIKYNNLKIPIYQISNLLYLYILLLGDLIVLDQYLNPLKSILEVIKFDNNNDLELISSLLIFPYPKIRILLLKIIKETLENKKLLINDFVYIYINISKEINIFKSELNDIEDLNIIFNISNELIFNYKEKEKNEDKIKLINYLIETITSPIITKSIQKNISKTISEISNNYLEVTKIIIEYSSNIFSNYDEKKIFNSDDWPYIMKRSLVSNMIPYTTQYLDDIIPKSIDSSLNKTVSRIQARHSIGGLILCLKEIINKCNEDYSSIIESSIRFILIKVIDSHIFQDSLFRNDIKNNVNINKNNDKKIIKNIVNNFSNKTNSQDKNKIEQYDIESKNNLQEVIIDFFVTLSTKKEINNSASEILVILEDLSNQYKPLINPNEFHNILAFAIGCITSCCSPKDTIVHKVTCKIINELLNGSLYKTINKKECLDEKINSELDIPLLTDIPHEYTKILPKLFDMIYNNTGNNNNNNNNNNIHMENSINNKNNNKLLEDLEITFINSFEDIDKKYLNYLVNIDDINKGNISIFKLYMISLSNILYSNESVIRIGSAHIFGSLTKGLGIKYLKDFGILYVLNNKINNQLNIKNDKAKIECILLCIGSLSIYLEYLIEPYSIIFLKNLMQLFSENDQFIRFYSQKTAEIIVKNLSKYGTKLILPVITKGIEEKQWRIKLTSLQLLGLMAVNSPHQLSSFLPKAIQTIYQATSDSHPKVSEAAEETLYNIVNIIKNPEIKLISQDLMNSLIDPTEINFKKALLSLKSITFIHEIDITTLSLIFPVLLKAIQERGMTDLRKDSIQILTSILHLLGDKSDIDPFLPMIEYSIHITLTDPIPEVRLLTAKLCRSIVKITGQEKISSLLNWLFKTLSSDVNQTLKSGVSAALSEILATFGIEKFKQILPFIINQIQNNEESKDKFEISENNSNEKSYNSSSITTKEGYIGLFVYLPKSFGDELGPLMPKILPQLLYRLGDESDTVRDIALKACKALVVQFGSDHITYILQPLENGLSNDSWRVRLSCCSLLGTLLNILIKSQLNSNNKLLHNDISTLDQSGFSFQRRSYILAAIYMARNDENISVKNSATTLWKSLVQNTPQTLKDILPILTRRIINALSASNKGNLHYIAIQTLKDLLEKFGNSLQNKLLPIFYQNLGGILNEDGTMNLNSYETVSQSNHTNIQIKIGSCIGLLEILKTIKKNELKNYSSSFLPIIKIGLLDSDLNVRSLSVNCLDLFASENIEILFSIINWLLDDIFSESSEFKNIEDCINNPRISTIELIIQLSHTGIISKIIPRITSKPIDIRKLHIIKALSKIPSQNRLRLSLFEIVPLLIDTCVQNNNQLENNLLKYSQEAMINIVQSLDDQGMETYCTIIFDIIRENTPNTNLTISGRYQIEDLKISNFKDLDDEIKIIRRVQSIIFLEFSIFMNSTIYETSYSLLIKYLIPLAICDISEDVRISASKAFQTFSNSIPRKLIVKISSLLKETIGSLVHDPIDNKKHFSNIKLIGLTWIIENYKVQEKYELKDELIKSNNKLIDSITSIYIQAISLGNNDSKEECAIGLGESIKLTSNESIKPITIKLVGPLIRLISDRTTVTIVRSALLNNLVLFLELCGIQLRPLLPQIQTILLKYLLDPNEIIRKECSNGIGYLCKYLGNRAEILLNDLCSLASKYNQSNEIFYSLLNAINSALINNESTTKLDISTTLRNKLIGITLNIIRESDIQQHQKIAGEILSSILIYYCELEEIKNIIYPLLTTNSQVKNLNDKNILNILNSFCEFNGWEKIYESFENIPLDSELIDKINIEQIKIPLEYSEKNYWFYSKVTLLILDNIFNSNNNENKMFAINLIANLGIDILKNNNKFSVSLILQVFPKIIEKDVSILFPKFSDSNLILQIQKLCEIIIENEEVKNLFIKEIDMNLKYYSFSNNIKNDILSENILISIISLPSIQSLNSKFPVIKLKAEQILVSIIRSIIQLNNSFEIEDQEDIDKFDQIIVNLINDINTLYPDKINLQQSGFIKEYSRRVLCKIFR